MAKVFIICVPVIIFVWYIFTYNKFVARRNKVKQCESSICVMLKQRNDLIPNIVKSVKQYIQHEYQTLTEVTRIRSKATETTNRQEQISLGNKLSTVLPKINIIKEEYPQLKADHQFTQLMDALEEMELQLQAARRTYNAAVTDFNNTVEMLPSSILASIHNYKCFDFIEIPEIEKLNINTQSLFS